MKIFLKMDECVDSIIKKLQDEIRSFDLLNEYNFKLISELPNNAKPAKKTIYFEADNNKLKYTVLVGPKKVEDFLDIRPTIPLTKTFLESNKKEILKFTAKRGHTKSSLQSKMIQLESIKAYKDHSQDSDLSIRVNELIEKVMPYSDRNEHEYDKISYGPILFELAIFSFIDNHINFNKVKQKKDSSDNKKSDRPDFIFEENDVMHYIECTTNTSGLFDKFLEFKQRLNNYLNAATILYKDFKEKKDLYPNRIKTSLYSAFMRDAVYKLNPEKQRDFISYLSLVTAEPTEISLEKEIKIFKKYTNIINYACFHHKELIDVRILSEPQL